jgi:hypothetical protein
MNLRECFRAALPVLAGAGLLLALTAARADDQKGESPKPPPKGAGALYGLIAPEKEAQQKAVRPPEQWNTYDITFHAPRVDDQGKVTEKGRITVVLNGVPIIQDGQFDKVTGGAINDKIGTPGPLLLQDHHNKKGAANVRYRNIWLLPLSPKQLESK